MTNEEAVSRRETLDRLHSIMQAAGLSQRGVDSEAEKRITAVVRERGLPYVGTCRDGKVMLMGDFSAADLRALAEAMEPTRAE